MSKELYSTHILMFPFVFTERIDEINKALTVDGNWKYQAFDAGKSAENYNEYIYFYEYVRKSLYSQKKMSENQTSYYFEHKEQKGTLTLEVKNKKYELEVDGISMRTFNTKVGILSIELLNHKYSEAEEILEINEFSRRLYPQYLDKEKGVEGTKNNILANSVHLKPHCEKAETFSYYADMKNISQDATNLPNYIHTLLGERFSSRSDKGKIHIEPIIDDRMFVISMYINAKIGEELKSYNKENAFYAYENDDFWYKYIFIDAGETMCQSEHMIKKLIAESTYDRWVEWETLFGISRYSFVALTEEWFGKNILKSHMHTMYFQIFTLLLAYRASMLNFSKRVSEIMVGEMALGDLQRSVTELYKEYINFQNNLFFREVTAQEQGIELYNQALRIMQIEKHIRDLDAEISELHTYVSMRMEEEKMEQAEKRENELATISKIGAIFLPPTVIAGIFGINTVHFDQSIQSMWTGGALILLSGVSGLMVIRKKGIIRIFWGILLITIILTALFLMPKSFPDDSDHLGGHTKTKEIKNVKKPNR